MYEKMGTFANAAKGEELNPEAQKLYTEQMAIKNEFKEAWTQMKNVAKTADIPLWKISPSSSSSSLLATRSKEGLETALEGFKLKFVHSESKYAKHLVPKFDAALDRLRVLYDQYVEKAAEVGKLQGSPPSLSSLESGRGGRAG